MTSDGPGGGDRRLAAILSADVVGFSRLMGADESDTLSQLKAHRGELIDPEIATHHGRIVNTAGDSVLAEFASVVDAVQCAVTIQRTMDDRNRDIPEDRRLTLRIGINVGDVIADGDDIFGDGVNVAARLQALTEPGTVCISRPARDQIRDKLALELEDLGEHSVKNIARPVRAFRVSLKQADGGGSPETETPLALPDKPSIAVLPFDNMSGDPEQEYFSDGIAEDVITDLSKIAALFVIARNSAFKYKGEAVDVSKVSRELGVRYVLEGSVRKAGQRVRINAQLIDGTTGGHLWAERYDGDVSDVFGIQDEVTGKIVDALKLKLTPDEKERLDRRGTNNVEAHDCYLRGRELSRRFQRGSNAEARAMFERAIELDPSFVEAYVGLSGTHGLDAVNQWSDSPQASQVKGIAAATRGGEIDDSVPDVHVAQAWANVFQRRYDEAIRSAERAIALDPNSAEGYTAMAMILDYTGHHGKPVELLEKAMRLDPQHPDLAFHQLAHAHFMEGRYVEAAGLLERRIVRNPETDISRVLLASCYGHLDRAEDARAMWQEVFRINPEYSFAHRLEMLPYKDPADRDRTTDGLKKAGIEW